MAVTHTPYDSYLLDLLSLSPSIDLDAGGTTIKVALLHSTYTPNLHTDNFFDDISAFELAAGSGYTAGGNVVGTKVTGIDGVGYFAYFSGDIVQWPTFTATDIRYAVVYMDTGTPSTSPLITLIDFGAAEAIATGTFSVVWAPTASGGILRTVAA